MDQAKYPIPMHPFLARKMKKPPLDAGEKMSQAIGA
jgi:hypothetical protein